MTENIQYKWMVFVRCMTYNQAPFIIDAMNGFTMQQTDFPFVCVIVDDASTDGEQEIIKQYLKDNFDLTDTNVVRKEETTDFVRFFAQHKENKNCFFVIILLKYNHYRKKTKRPYFEEWYKDAKYIALCEGDDYWIDAQKLQKQINYFSNHEKCSMCFTDFDILYEDGQSAMKSALTTNPKLYPHKYTLEEWIFRTGYVGPMTWVIKKELLEHRPTIRSVDGTFIRFASFLANTEVGCLVNDTTAVYRRLQESASHSKSLNKQYKFRNGVKKAQIELAMYYKEKLPNAEVLINKIINKYYHDRRYILLCAIVGDNVEMTNIMHSRRSMHLNVLFTLSKYKILRDLFALFYKLVKHAHFVIYKKNLGL